MDCKIEVNETYSYYSRCAFSGVIWVAFLIVMIIAGDKYHYMSNGANAFLIISITAVFYYYSDDPLGTRYFLLSFEKKGEDVSITYKDKTETKEIKGKRKDFTAAIIYRRASYIEIKHRGERLLREYYYRGLSKSDMNKIIACLSNKPEIDS